VSDDSPAPGQEAQDKKPAEKKPVSRKGGHMEKALGFQ
jgi:hypothetical protein